MKAKIVFYVISILIYPLIIYVITPYLASFGATGGSDAMGDAMALAFLMIYTGIALVIVTFIACLIISKMYLHSFVPAPVSLLAGFVVAYALYVGDSFVEHNKKQEYIEYYDSGKIQKQGKTIGGAYDKHGEITYYDEEGRIEKIETRKRGILNGMYRDFYENGALKSQGALIATQKHEDGDKNGKWKFYRADGQLDDERTYKKGELRSSLNYKFFFSPHYMQVCVIKNGSPYNGKLDKTPVVSESEIPYLYSFNVIEGEADGSYIAYYADGNKPVAKTGYFEQGLPKGKFVNYYENGQLEQICNYENGKLNGEYFAYYQDSLGTMPHGNLEYNCHYTDDERNGTACWYDSNGKLRKQEQYLNGKREGISRTYDTQTGEITSESLYKDDWEVPTKESVSGSVQSIIY